MYKYSNRNPLQKLENDCVIRAISCATNRSWDSVYDELSDLAQYNGTMMDDRDFIIWYLNSNYRKVLYLPKRVGEVSKYYKNKILLITMNGHITCSKYGVIYDTFDCRDYLVENAWIV